MSYCTADLAPHAASIQRDRAGFFVVGRERTARLDIALLLVQSRATPAGARRMAPRSPRLAEARERAQRAVLGACRALARSAPAGERQALNATQRAAVDRLSHSDLAASMGAVLAREVGPLRQRLRRLEQRALAQDPQAVRRRAGAAVQRAAGALR
ncbi:MAG: hypothetical protein J7605_17285 [Variovorax sp.]|nr:hypothetical protein [Variovorax sp.]